MATLATAVVAGPSPSAALPELSVAWLPCSADVPSSFFWFHLGPHALEYDELGKCFVQNSRSTKLPKSVVGLRTLSHWSGRPRLSSDQKKRRVSVFAASQDAEKSFQKTVEVDRLIDVLKDSHAKEFDKLVVENILAFDESFWIRLAARTDSCKSDDDKKDYEELATSVMSVVDRLVHKTNEKIESSTDVLKSILKPVVSEDEEISWPPRQPDALILMERELEQREQEGQLDEGFLSEVNAQLRQAKEDGDKPGLEAMLQKVLQMYASKILSKRSYAKKGNEVLRTERLLESVIKAPEESWNRLLIEGLMVGTGDIAPDDFYAVIKKRIERTLIRTEGGSYQQRILVEYLKGIESRAEELVLAIQGKQS